MPFITQGKTNWKFLVIILCVAIIIIIGFLWFFDAWQKILGYEKLDCDILCGNGTCENRIIYDDKPHCFETKESCPKDCDETADWQTYRNEEYGFEFKYPGIFDRFENCKLIENDNTVAVGSRFAISILDAKELNLLEYVAKVREESLREQVFPPPEEAWHQEDIYVGGIKGIKVVWFHGSRYSQMIYLSKDNRIFDIGFTAGISCLDYYVEQGLLDENELRNELDIFEQIPITFRFLE